MRIGAAALRPALCADAVWDAPHRRCRLTHPLCALSLSRDNLLRCACAEPLAQCAQCMYSFCTLCADGWHPGRRCLGMEERQAVLADRMQKLTVRR